MSQQIIKYRVAAISDAAGKYNPDAPFNGNEDNFYVDDDLSNGDPGSCRTDEYLTMGPLGCLLVVADGMGGMNAGEVASAIAIDTVKRAFAPGAVSAETAADADSRRRYLEQVVRLADRRIKEDASANPDHKGMGSTIIMAWIVGDKLTLTWCGDSRAYRFNPVNGITPLSTDHSYVQQLVNQGVISYEDTFEHPQGNIITRSLGDPTKQAEAESREFQLYTGDIILLCSDGLSGVLRDRLTYDRSGVPFAGDNIEDVIASNLEESLSGCRDALMSAARDADWYDNVTVVLFELLSGAPAAVKVAPAAMPPMPRVAPQPVRPAAPEVVTPVPKPAPSRVVTPTPAPQRQESSSSNLIMILIAILVTVVLIGAGAWYYFHQRAKAERYNAEPGQVEATLGGRPGSGHGGIGLHGSGGVTQGSATAPASIADLRANIQRLGASDSDAARKCLVALVDSVTTEPLRKYAKELKEEINAENFSQKHPREYLPMIDLLRERGKLVAAIDPMMEKANDEDRESLKSIRKALVSTTYLSRESLIQFGKGISEIARHQADDHGEDGDGGQDDDDDGDEGLVLGIFGRYN